MLPERLARRLPFYYGWVIVAVMFGANFSRAPGNVALITVFVPVLAAEHGWSRTLISSAVSIGSLMGAGVAPLAGRLTDRYGARLVVVAAMAALGGFCLALGFIQSVAFFVVALSIVRMTAQGVLPVVAATAPAKWFTQRRALAIAISMTGGFIPLMVLPVALQATLAHGGLRAGWLFMGSLALALGVVPPALFLVRRPEDIGLLPDGADPRRASTGLARGVRTSSPATSRQWTFAEATRTPSLWLLVLSAFLVSGTFAGVSLHQVPYYEERGLTATVAASVVSVYAAGLAVGSLVWGWLTGRMSGRWLMVLSCLQTAASAGLLLAVHSAPLAFLFAFTLGLVGGGLSALLPILVASYFGSRSMGSINGLVEGAAAAGLALGSLLAGVVYDVTGAYQGAFISFGVLSMLAAALAYGVRRPSHRAARRRAISPSGGG